jgi:C-terminal peptidase prc
MTRKTLIGFAASLILVCLAYSPSFGEESKLQPCVVLVGINHYQDKQILARPHAEADAQALYDLLTDKQYLGVPADHVRLLLGDADAKRGSEPATHANILKALTWASTTAGKNDPVIVAIFAQGAPLGDRFCYFATDSTFKDRAKNAVAGGEIEHALEKLKSQKFCVFVDVNFKGFEAPKDASPEANLSALYREFMGNRNEDHSTNAGRLVFIAETRLRPSLELADHGAFAKVIIDGLSGAADKEGYEPDGVVTLDELIEYVNKELPALAREHGKTKEDKEQRGFVLGGMATHYELTSNPSVTAKVKERLTSFEKLATEKNLSKELTTEGRRLLASMPKLEAYRNIRRSYQKLVDGKLSVDEFTKERSKILDDMKITGSTARAYAAKVIQATQLLQREYVKEINQGELVAAAIKGLYVRIEEKIPPDIKARLDKVKDLKESELVTLLTDVRQRLGNREDLDNHHDLDFALQRMMAPLDPYTTYIDPETLAQFKRETAGDFVGIGIQIRVDSTRDMIVVVTPIKGSPAYKAGILAGDIITQVTREVDEQGKPLEKPDVLSTKGLLIQDAVKKIVGKVGTPVKITVEREGVDHPLDFEIKRGHVEVETVLGTKRKADDSWEYYIDRENKIGYVRLTSFAKYTSRDLGRALELMKNTDGIQAFILDLRFNPGGLLTSAVEISDMFIDDGLIVTIRPRVGNQAAYSGEHEGSLLDFPMVCLVNGHSASGSEIVSACLQDHGRAIIMGERSYGKGSVQNIQPFEDGELKLTTASFWRPSGKNLNRSSTNGKEDAEWGVTPDPGYTVKLSRKERDELELHFRDLETIPRRDLPTKEATPDFKDVQLEKALRYLRGQIKIASQAPARKTG